MPIKDGLIMGSHRVNSIFGLRVPEDGTVTFFREIKDVYVNARGVRYSILVCINDIITKNSLGQRFEERGRGRPADVFNIIQKRPNTVVHLKTDAAMESRRSYKEVRSR